MTDKNREMCELLGIQWHEQTGGFNENTCHTHQCVCGYRSMLGGLLIHCDKANPNFTTDSGKVLLLKEMRKREDWPMFIWRIGGLRPVGSTTGTYQVHEFVMIDLILGQTPGKLADLALEWMRREKG